MLYMNTETERPQKTEEKESVKIDKKVHQTHFSVTEKLLNDIHLNAPSFVTDNEWISDGNGHWKLVHNKKAKN